MAYTEFCCRSGGSNLNAGTRTGNSTEPGVAADFTYASGTWVSATGVFTVASGNPSADGVAVGDYASVYADGATATTLVGRVTARTTTTITVSTTAKAGTTTGGTNTRTLKIGGAWSGPSGAESFPFKSSSFDFSALENASSDTVRINLKNDASYTITAGLSAYSAANGFAHVTGYTASYGDFGKALITASGTGVCFTLLSVASLVQFFDIIFDGNGAAMTGFAVAVISDDTRTMYTRCVFRNSRGSGLYGGQLVRECEAHSCNISNTSGRGGFEGGNLRVSYVRCISHDNAGSNNLGFYVTNAGATFESCIAESNGSVGFQSTNSVSVVFSRCDSYNNGGAGIAVAGGNNISAVENCNLVKNGGWGIALPSKSSAFLLNNRFGAGTQANTSGTIQNGDNATSIDQTSYVSDVTPWTDPANGDFRISLAAAKAAGRGSFTQTAASYAGTVGYPDIGAAQSAASGSSGIPIARGMHGGMR